VDGFSLSEKKGRDDERGGGASKAGLPFLELNNAAGCGSTTHSRPLSTEVTPWHCRDLGCI